MRVRFINMRESVVLVLRSVSTSANSVARPSDGLSEHAQLEIQV